MKILFVSDNYPPYIKGGAAVSTSLVAQWLSEHGHTVSVACFEFSDQPWIQNGIRVYPIILKPYLLKSRNFLSAAWYAIVIIFKQFISAIRVLRLMRDLKPDIVNIVPADYRSIPIILGMRIFSNCPIVVDCRDYSLICPAHLSAKYFDGQKDFDETIQSHHGYRCIGYGAANNFSFLSIRPFAIYESFLFNLYKSSLRFLVNHFDGIRLVGVSQYVQQQLILNGFNAEKTTHIYNISQSFEKKHSAVTSKIPTFAYGGRIEEDKGIWDLIHAIEIVKRELQAPFAVKIAGTGDAFDELQKYARDHDLKEVTLLGHIKPEEVLDLYAQSLAIIGPSRIPEPFGRFILDSISVGKPVITTRTGGMPEGVEDKITGLLVEVGNVEQLAAAKGDSVFVDAGANIGTYTIRAAQLIGSRGKVIAIEAHPFIYSYLLQNIKLNELNNVIPLNVALGAEMGVTEMSYNASNAGQTHIAISGEQRVSVPLQTLDNILQELGVSSIDYLKIDVEGFEFSLLKGAEEIIAKSPHVIVQTELIESHAQRYGRPITELINLLFDWGLTPHKIDFAGHSLLLQKSDIQIPSDVLWWREKKLNYRM